MIFNTRKGVGVLFDIFHIKLAIFNGNIENRPEKKMMKISQFLSKEGGGIFGIFIVLNNPPSEKKLNPGRGERWAVLICRTKGVRSEGDDHRGRDR